MKIGKFLIILLLFLPLLSSCSKNEKEELDILYNFDLSHNFVGNGKEIFSKGVFSNIEDIKTGRVKKMTRDPFYFANPHDVEMVEQYYVTDKYLYKLENTDKTYFLKKVNLKNYNEETIFKEKNEYDPHDVFLGLVDTQLLENESSIPNYSEREFRGFFVLGKNIIFLRQNGIYQLNLKTKKEKSIYEGANYSSVSSDGKQLYYINNLFQMYCYNFSSKTTVTLSNCRAMNFVMDKTNIYFKNISDNGYLYKMNKDGSDLQKISEVTASSITFDDNYLFISDFTHLYRMKRDGSDFKKIGTLPVYSMNTFKNSEKIYFISDSVKPDNGWSVFFSMNKDGSDIQEISYMSE